MKKLIQIALLAITMLFVFQGCRKDKNEVPKVIIINSTGNLFTDNITGTFFTTGNFPIVFNLTIKLEIKTQQLGSQVFDYRMAVGTSQASWSKMLLTSNDILLDIRIKDIIPDANPTNTIYVFGKWFR